MEYRRLGRTEVMVSAVALGCWALAGDATWGAQEEPESIATIEAALDCGINFFDTAEAYGDGYSEEIVGKALVGKRKDVVLATKFNASRSTAAGVMEACENSLRRLGTDYIDLYQVHWRSAALPLEELAGALETLVRQGKVRYYGVCNFGPGDLSDFLPLAAIVSNQLPYSLLWRAIEFEIVEPCRDHGLSVLPYSPLAQGLLTGKFRFPGDVPEGRARTRHFAGSRTQTRHGEPGAEEETFAALDRIREISERCGRPMADVSLAWLLARAGVTSVLAGARHPAQVRENASAAGLALAPGDVQDLSQATNALKDRLGANPDMWQGESRYR